MKQQGPPGSAGRSSFRPSTPPAVSSVHFLEFVPFFSVFLIATLGLASLALSLSVWRRRRQAIRAQRGWRQSISRMLVPLGVAGAFAIILSLSLRTFFPRKGELFLRDALVVRADSVRGTPSTAKVDQLRSGEALLRFEKAGQDAELERLSIETKRLAVEREKVSHATQTPDPDLVREQQELATERRSLLQRLATFDVERQRLEHYMQSEIIDKRLRRSDIIVRLGEFDGELAKKKSELEYAKIVHESARLMRDGDVLSKIDYAEKSKNIAVLEADIARLERGRGERQRALKELSEGIVGLTKTLATDLTSTRQNLGELRAVVEDLRRQDRRLAERLRKEPGRLKQERANSLREVDLKLADCMQQIAVLESLAIVRCPSDGQVLYRHPSPKSAQNGDALIMFGAKDAVRARFKLSSAEATHLRRAGTIELLATSDEILTARLNGQLVSETALPLEPGIVVVELACRTTESQLQFLSRGLSLDVRLLWASPLFMDPLLVFGAILLLVAFVTSLGLRSRKEVALGVPRQSKLLSEVDPKSARAAQTQVRSG